LANPLLKKTRTERVLKEKSIERADQNNLYLKKTDEIMI
jgi:hypothetical protein